MKFNEDFMKAMIEIKLIQSAYANGKEFPLVARKFIEMGAEKGIKIQIEYGTNTVDGNTYAGYWIKAPEKDKAIFQQDIYIDDESEENVAAAVRWMGKSLENLSQVV